MTIKRTLPRSALLALTLLAGCARPDPLELPELSLEKVKELAETFRKMMHGEIEAD